MEQLRNSWSTNPVARFMIASGHIPIREGRNLTSMLDMNMRLVLSDVYSAIRTEEDVKAVRDALDYNAGILRMNALIEERSESFESRAY